MSKMVSNKVWLTHAAITLAARIARLFNFQMQFLSLHRKSTPYDYNKLGSVRQAYWCQGGEGPYFQAILEVIN